MQINGISISQHDDIEKAGQVAFMGEVFKAAKVARVWVPLMQMARLEWICLHRQKAFLRCTLVRKIMWPEGRVHCGSG